MLPALVRSTPMLNVCLFIGLVSKTEKSFDAVVGSAPFSTNCAITL